MSDSNALTFSKDSNFSLMKVSNPDPIAVVDQEGRVFVYTESGDRLDTGVIVSQSTPNILYETLRALGLKCATISNTTE